MELAKPIFIALTSSNPLNLSDVSVDSEGKRLGLWKHLLDGLHVRIQEAWLGMTIDRWREVRRRRNSVRIGKNPVINSNILVLNRTMMQ